MLPRVHRDRPVCLLVYVRQRRGDAAAAVPLYGVQAKLQADICVLHGLTCYVTKEFFWNTEKF